MLTIDDLRSNTALSGFRYVTFLRGERPLGSSGHSSGLRGGRKDKYRAHKKTAAGDWYGPCRLTNIEAAADAAVYLNGGGIAAGARLTPVPDLSPRKRVKVAATTTRKTGFPAAMRSAIHARAGGACESCGLRYAYPDAHHINDNGEHSMDNGASLCKNCHGITYLGSPAEAAAINKKLSAKRAAEKRAKEAVT